MTLPREPLVSIVTPSFNQGGFIAETIASVLGQDYPHVEYLVVDGGSTDGTLDILRRFGHRLSWSSEPDRGQSDAINKGWRGTHGEIIAWLNADDLYRPSAITKVVAFFQQHPDIDLVYGDCDFINEGGDVLGRHHKGQASAADLVRSPVSLILQPAAFLRRRVLESVGYLDETLQFIMDMEYWLRVASRHNISHLPECLAAFRVHGGSKSGRQSQRFEDERLRVYEQFFKSPTVPDHLKRLEREAMRNVYSRAANDHFLAGDMKQAQHFAAVSWRYLPLRPQRIQLKVLVLGLAGSRGVRLAAWLRNFAGAAGGL
jgi:glycosyltransferase involved in cell wall biosynthesis